MSEAHETQDGGDHYKSLPIQPVDYCQQNGLKFCEASVVKYITRHRSKGYALDVKKAIHFCQLLLKIEYGIEAAVSYDEQTNFSREWSKNDERTTL